MNDRRGTPGGSGEFALIDRYFRPLAAGCQAALGLADDAAVLAAEPGTDLVVTVDALVAGVHFLAADPADLIARKALRTNLSDLAAMGADAVGYLLALALVPPVDEEWLDRFAAGLRQDQQAFGVVLLGGDTVATPGPVTVTVTALGRVPTGQALRRDGARPGDDLYVSGTLGDSALGLAALQGGLPDLAAGHRLALVERYHLPRPRLALGRALRGIASAAMDVSDGLAGDLRHLCTASGVGAQVDQAALPLSTAARAALDAAPELAEAVLSGGDDYEILFTAPPDRRAAVADAAAPVAVSRIGSITDAAGLVLRGPGGGSGSLSARGFTHF